MNRTTILLLGLLVSVTVLATDKRIGQINAIKKDSTYLYGEATLPTKEEATSLAYELFQKEVLAWVQHDGIKLRTTSLTDINALADTMMMPRANMVRVFVYAKKKSLLAEHRDTTVVTKDSLTSKGDSLVTDSVRQIIKQRFFGRKHKNDTLYRLKKAKNFFELKEIMQPLKEKGDILDYGKYATAEHPEQCYLIVYDAAGNIKALLGKGKEVRKNLKTGRDDSIGNYRGCGAIWFILSEE